MNSVEAEIKELPGGGRLLVVSVLVVGLETDPAFAVKLVFARMEMPPMQIVLAENRDATATAARSRLKYQAVLPPEIKAGKIRISVHFRNGAKRFKYLKLGSSLDRAILKVQLRLRKWKMKSLRRAARRRKRGTTAWDSFSSKLTVYFLRRIWTRWVRVRHGRKGLFFTITNPERIGHLASESEIFYAEAEQGIHPKGKYCLVLHRDAFVEDVGTVRIDKKLKDSYLLKMLKRHHSVATINRRHMAPLARRYVDRRNHRQRDIHGVLDMVSPLLAFTPREIEEGWKQLRPLGLTPDTPFVCLHLRESGYVHKLYNVDNFPKLRYSYRDVTTENYVPTIRHLIDQGYWVVRLGVPPVDACSITDKRYVDYANLAQSSFLDLFLCGHCAFFLGTTSGLYAVADLFRRPILYTNFAPLRHIHSWSDRYLTVPKVAYYRVLNRLLTFEEMVIRGFGDIIHGEKVEALGIDYISNTEEEILEGAIEMIARLRNEWKQTPEDRQLQERFWSAIPRDDLNQVIRARVGAHFLRKYKALLPAYSTSSSSQPLALPAPKLWKLKK